MRKTFTENDWRDDPWFKNLCKAIVACKTEKQAADFLRDVGTLTELQAWSERLDIARRIVQGETYRSITENTGASTTTVTRVARFLQNGSGYLRVLNAHRHHRHAQRGERMESKTA